MNTKYKKITLRLPQHLYDKLQNSAATVGHSVTEEINQHLSDGVNKDELSIESLIPQFEILLSQMKQLGSLDNHPTSTTDNKIIKILHALDEKQKQMVVKFIQSISQ